MSNTQSTITVSSHDCEYACLKTIEQYEQQGRAAWEQAINFEMNRKPFLWVFDKPATSREQAIQRIQAECVGPFDSSPDSGERFKIAKIRTVLAMAQRSEQIVLTKEDFLLIGHNVPIKIQKNYRQ